ncbi:MAG: integrase [Pseudomonadota bacterium]|nr:integrase [Pseudomonadota bacterium]
MTNTSATAITAEQIKVILSDILRAELNRIIDAQNAGEPIDDDELDLQIQSLTAQGDDMRHHARKNDFRLVDQIARDAAARLGITLPEDLPSSLGRRVTDLARDILDLEVKALDGYDAVTEAADSVARFSALPVDDFVRTKPVTLSAAWAKTLELYPTRDMKGNIDAIAKVALAFFGDVPVATITTDRQTEFFKWMSRLPKSHGKGHGKNRFCPDAPKDPSKALVTKDDEIEAADEADYIATEALRDRDDLSDLEKRALLSEQLVPRLTNSTLKRNRDGLNRLMKGARALGSTDLPEVISYRDVERIVKALGEEKQDPLYLRVVQSKLRMPWTEERLSQLLTSPIYAGCFSESRRWRPGNVIIRDAFYWVPLIVMMIGSRIKEILLLERRNIIWRNGEYCFAIAKGAAQLGKTDDAYRVVPIPQILLDLGFIEWWKGLDDAHGPLLFPEAANRSAVGKVTEPFSKAYYIILNHLDLGDADEDFYALRKTFHSLLRAADVADGQRQAIAGHRTGSIMNIHYTAHRTKELKEAVDKAEFALEIGFSEEHGFPIILSCGLSKGSPLFVDVTLADDGTASEIVVSEDGKAPRKFATINAATGQKIEPIELCTLASSFKELTDERTMRLPKHPLKRQAVEHFRALG